MREPSQHTRIEWGDHEYDDYIARLRQSWIEKQVEADGAMYSYRNAVREGFQHALHARGIVRGTVVEFLFAGVMTRAVFEELCPINFYNWACLEVREFTKKGKPCKLLTSCNTRKFLASVRVLPRIPEDKAR